MADRASNFDFEDRLVGFAADTIVYAQSLEHDLAGNYYRDQLIRSTGGAALNYGEAQGAVTTRDFVHKASLVLKELKETRVSFKILTKVDAGDKGLRTKLAKEVEELVAIVAAMIRNKKL